MLGILSSPSALAVGVDAWDSHSIQECIEPDLTASHLSRDRAFGFPQYLVMVEPAVVQVPCLGRGSRYARNSLLILFLFLRPPLTKPVLRFSSNNVNALIFLDVLMWVDPVFLSLYTDDYQVSAPLTQSRKALSLFLFYRYKPSFLFPASTALEVLSDSFVTLSRIDVGTSQSLVLQYQLVKLIFQGGYRCFRLN